MSNTLGRWRLPLAMFVALAPFGSLRTVLASDESPIDAVATSAAIIDDRTTGFEFDVAPSEPDRHAGNGAPNDELLSGIVDADVVPANRLQPQPALTPRLEVAPQPRLSPVALSVFSSLDSSRDQLSLERRSRAGTAGSTVILGLESAPRATTDAGNLIGKSPASLGAGTQRRTPIVTDPRVRGSRVGRLAASGSHWVPARIDLDTALSKLDSRIVNDVIVTGGPYAVIHGPGLDFMDIDLRDAPRNEDGFAVNGATSIEYKTNGQQWYGRQAVMGGDDLWGFRLGYGHRTGNDYLSGDNTEIPASYKSRDVDLALGADLTENSKIEFTYLRLDQTDVEFPGQAFDIDFLVTDGYEVEYEVVDQREFDKLQIDAWYNRTRFEGSAQRPGKRRQFPFYDVLSFVAHTDVDSMSTGYRAAMSWGDDEGPRLAVGTDLRAIRQELNEIASGGFLFSFFQDANSPIPRSDWTNPGLFTELNLPVDEFVLLKAGRADVTSTDVIDDPAKLAALGLGTPQSSLADILGTGDFDQSWGTWAAFVSAEIQLDDSWTLIASGGTGQQPPNLTELYAAQSFMFLLQNGLNTVTGDPLLSTERSYQVDLSLQIHTERFRGAIRGFHAWVHDYITFENLGVFPSPASVEQVRLKYVNTELATLAGAELHAEYDASKWLTPFGTVTYLDGRDRARNGDFATQRATTTTPSQRDYGLSRGAFSTIAGGAAEPLPGILPLEGRAGVRVHQSGPRPRWAVEFAVRMVDRQDRVATSLLESPTPGFATFDVRGVWRATDRLSIVAGVENLTDIQYREHLDFRSPNGKQMFQPGVSGYFSTELTY